MSCYGCSATFRDKGGTVARSTYHSICWECMCKVLQTYPTEPADLISLYYKLRAHDLYIYTRSFDTRTRNVRKLRYFVHSKILKCQQKYLK